MVEAPAGESHCTRLTAWNRKLGAAESVTWLQDVVTTASMVTASTRASHWAVALQLEAGAALLRDRRQERPQDSILYSHLGID